MWSLTCSVCRMVVLLSSHHSLHSCKTETWAEHMQPQTTRVHAQVPVTETHHERTVNRGEKAHISRHGSKEILDIQAAIHVIAC